LQRIDNAVVVDPALQENTEKVFFGAWVSLYNLDKDSEHHFRIVGQDELEPSKGYISWVSPLAKAILGKQIGDTIRVQTPAGEESYEVLDVQYHAPD
jgi:transcription elongation factor GreB